jgi:hypothetical protein
MPQETQGEKPNAAMDLPAFIARHPPNSPAAVLVSLDPTSAGAAPLDLELPPVMLHCDGAGCAGERWFDPERTTITTNTRRCLITYTCRNCRETSKLYGFLLQPPKTLPIVGKALFGMVKVAEWPEFGPHTPPRVSALLGRDRDLYFKGRRSESQGLGIGAYSYYRRVVEHQKNRLLDEILKVAEKTGARPDLRAAIEAAKKETRFSQAIAGVKDLIPDVLKIDGQNPLTLLHTALSKGLHELSEAECLARAGAIRVVLVELADRMEQLLRDHRELKGAVAALQNPPPPAAPPASTGATGQE